MILSRPIKLLVGFVTAWPPLYMLIFMGTIFAAMAGAMAGGPDDSMPAWFQLIFFLHFITILIMFGLLAFYIVYLFKTDTIAQDKKVLWAVVLFFGNAFAMPVFFWLYVWPDGLAHRDAAAQDKGA